MTQRALPLTLAATLLALLAGCREPASPPLAPLGDETRCAAYAGLPAGWPVIRDAGMVRVRAGFLDMGSRRGYAEERGLQRVFVAPFLMDATEVSNAQFAAFVRATGHVTDAELQGASVVFDQPHDSRPGSVLPNSWWQLRPGHDWRHPDGPASSLVGRGSQPVVHVSRRDAEAYAAWLGHRLPSEAEWEHASLAGRDDAVADAALRDASGRYLANVWQGLFPFLAQVDDGHAGRAPVGCYPANPFGLFDLVGNVWEWTASEYSEPAGPFGGSRRFPGRGVIKGGSYLCAASFCARARSAARQGQEADLPAGHVGFRTVVSVD